MSFSTLGLTAALQKAVSDAGFTEPYPIQQMAIPPILAGKDVLGVAQTGSGKTASYALPVIQLVQRMPETRNRHIKALVLVPTRELAVQVEEVFFQFSKSLPQKVKSMPVFGGVSINPQMMKLNGVEILVATPGRLLDLLDHKALHLSDVKLLVLDEADKMLNLGFKEEMTRIFGMLPYIRQNLLFSATLGKEVNTITEMLLRDPVKVEVQEAVQNLDIIQQIAYSVEDSRKGPLLRYLIKEQNMQQVLVFTSSIHRAEAVVQKLVANKIDAESIHSKRSQGARTDALQDFKSGRLRVLVATDIMSRGIDIPFLPFVINYELPRSPKDYIHRIGRTGRAENPGEAIALVSKEEEHHFGVIQKKMKRKVVLKPTTEIDLKGY
ncbi:MAG: DEAD/DEAH box helicase [Cytophagaceae bacterium]|jgi:ATP-dependent RNA helicase RhlE|nr:DEAD/DEAH box helicase [Cytophagaceae bacterium]